MELNHDKPIIEIKKYEKGAECPACKDGMLVGRRDRDTLKFLALDSCLLCGQQVSYGEHPQ